MILSQDQSSLSSSLLEIASNFYPVQYISGIKPLGKGNINDTYLVDVNKFSHKK